MPDPSRNFFVSRFAARRGLTGLMLMIVSGCTTPGDLTDGPERGIARRSGFGAGQRPQALTFSWPDGIRSGASLSEDQAIAVALWNNPGFQAALTDLGLARADVIKAGQLPNPALGLLFPNNASALEIAAKFPLDALWLRPLRVAAAQLDARAKGGHGYGEPERRASLGERRQPFIFRPSNARRSGEGPRGAPYGAFAKVFL